MNENIFRNLERGFLSSGGAKKPLEYSVIFQGFFASSGGKKIVIKRNMFSFTSINEHFVGGA